MMLITLINNHFFVLKGKLLDHNHMFLLTFILSKFGEVEVAGSNPVVKTPSAAEDGTRLPHTHAHGERRNSSSKFPTLPRRPADRAAGLDPEETSTDLISPPKSCRSKPHAGHRRRHRG